MISPLVLIVLVSEITKSSLAAQFRCAGWLALLCPGQLSPEISTQVRGRYQPAEGSPVLAGGLTPILAASWRPLF